MDDGVFGLQKPENDRDADFGNVQRPAVGSGVFDAVVLAVGLRRRCQGRRRVFAGASALQFQIPVVALHRPDALAVFNQAAGAASVVGGFVSSLPDDQSDRAGAHESRRQSGGDGGVRGRGRFFFGVAGRCIRRVPH